MRGINKGKNMIRKKSQNFRVFIVAILFFLISCMWMAKPSISIIYSGYINILVALISAIISTLFLKKSKKIKINIIFIMTTVILGSSFILSSYQFSDSNRFVIGICIAIISPIIALLSSHNESREVLYRGICIGVANSMIPLIILSTMFAPLLKNQYYSIVLNPNELSTILLPICISALYLYEYYRTNKRVSVAIYYAILLSIASAMMYLSMSRTGIIALVCTFIIYVISLFIQKNKFVDILKIVLIISFIMFLGLKTTTFLLNDVSRYIIRYQATNNKEVYMFLNKDYGLIDSEIVLKHIVTNNEKVDLDNIENRFLIGSREGEDVSSGRFAIWKSAFKELNFRGHSSADEFFVPERDKYTNDTHNFYLLVGYFIGIPTFIISILFYMQIIYISFKKFIYSCRRKLKLKNIDVFMWYIYSAFFILSMLSTTYTLTGSTIGLMFWLTIPIIKEGKK